MEEGKKVELNFKLSRKFDFDTIENEKKNK